MDSKDTSRPPFVGHTTERNPWPRGGMDLLQLVALDHASKRFGAAQAVRDLSLDVRAGEVVAFLGPNGAGRTTGRIPSVRPAAAGSSGAQPRRRHARNTTDR